MTKGIENNLTAQTDIELIYKIEMDFMSHSGY